MGPPQTPCCSRRLMRSHRASGPTAAGATARWQLPRACPAASSTLPRCCWTSTPARPSPPSQSGFRRRGDRPGARAPCSASPQARASSPSRAAADAESIVASLSARALSGLPEVRTGDDVAALIAPALAGEQPHGGQGIVIAHKVVSKAEGALVPPPDVPPGAQARELAAGTAAGGGGQERDPRAVQVVLDQSLEILRAERGVLICRTRHGFVCANAGVDASNAPAADT